VIPRVGGSSPLGHPIPNRIKKAPGFSGGLFYLLRSGERGERRTRGTSESEWGFTTGFALAKQYKEEARRADFIRELLRAGLREVNSPRSKTRKGESPCEVKVKLSRVEGSEISLATPNLIALLRN
jgi:hypothetical protein